MKKKINKELSDKIKLLIENIEANKVDVRFEKGRFKSSLCLVNHKKTLIVNKQMTQVQVIDFLESYIKNGNDILQAS